MSERGTGRFVTFEGGEGAGKTTQVRLLAERLRGMGISVVTTREPGGSPFAERVRGWILSGRLKSLGALGEMLAFALARFDHLRRVIRPALRRGEWVLCDRFIDSTRAYQGRVGRAPSWLLRTIERLVVGKTYPDLTLILDLPADEGLHRAAARAQGQDRFEAERMEFHEALRQAFRDIAAEEPERCVVIDAQLAEEDVAAQIWHAVEARLLSSQD